MRSRVSFFASDFEKFNCEHTNKKKTLQRKIGLLMNTNDRGGGFGGHNTASVSSSSALLSECLIRVENRFEIRVDTWGKKNAFSTNNNDILHQIPTFYFLTHMHQDHLRGLREDTFENDNNGRIYLSLIHI